MWLVQENHILVLVPTFEYAQDDHTLRYSLFKKDQCIGRGPRYARTIAHCGVDGLRGTNVLAMVPDMHGQ